MFNELGKMVGIILFIFIPGRLNGYLSEETTTARTKPSTADERTRLQGRVVIIDAKLVDKLVDKLLWKRKASPGYPFLWSSLLV